MHCFYAVLIVSFFAHTYAVPMPSPSSAILKADRVIARSVATPAPIVLRPSSSPDETYEFYQPLEKWAQSHNNGMESKEERNALQAPFKDAKLPSSLQSNPSLVQKRGATDSTPSFPAEYPSCYNCQQRYSSLSSCMEASSVFQNATSIFQSPLNYISVIKCACTDTFQAVYPQCVQCFQLTNQCFYLGTDAAGTGAPQIVTNLRNICGFASSILGGAQSANYPDYNHTFTPTEVPTFTDVTTTGVGYLNQATGKIFSGSLRLSITDSLPFLLACILASLLAAIML